MQRELEDFRENGFVYLISPETCNYSWFDSESNEVDPFGSDNFEWDTEQRYWLQLPLNSTVQELIDVIARQTKLCENQIMIKRVIVPRYNRAFIRPIKYEHPVFRRNCDFEIFYVRVKREEEIEANNCEFSWNDRERYPIFILLDRQ